MSTSTEPKAPAHPREPQSGEPDAGSRGPDVWPFETPKEPPAVERPERDIERPAERGEA